MTYADTKAERLAAVCARKKHYGSKTKARREAATLRRKLGVAIFIYQCPVCDDWLHTTQPQTITDLATASRRQHVPIADPDHH